MGIDRGGSLFHHANVGEFSQLIITLKHRAALNNRTGPPIVYFDASWFARKFAGHSMYDRISDLVYIFAMNGSSVVVVLDGPTRHHSKKARAARVMDALFDSLLLQKVMLQKIESMRNNTDLTPAEVESTKDEIICIEKEIKSRLF